MRFDIDAVFVDDDGPRGESRARDERRGASPSIRRRMPSSNCRRAACAIARSTSAIACICSNRAASASDCPCTICGSSCAEPPARSRTRCSSPSSSTPSCCSTRSSSVSSCAGRACGRSNRGLLGARCAHALSAPEAADGGCCGPVARARRRQLPVFHGAAAGDGVDVRVEGTARSADARYRCQLQRHDSVARQQRRRRLRRGSRADARVPRRSRECRPAAASCIRRWSVRMPRSTKPRECSVGWRVRDSSAPASSWTSRCATRRATSCETDVAEGNPTCCCIGAPDRLSVVFELPLEPRQVRSRRVENVLDIDVGPMSAKIAEQQWSAPEGVHLVERVSIEGVQASETGDFLRAHITLPEFARANVRAEGRRVYVDLTWPMIAPDAVAPRSAAAAADASSSTEPPVEPRRPGGGCTSGRAVTRGVCGGAAWCARTAGRSQTVSDVCREGGIARRAPCARRYAVDARNLAARHARAGRVARPASDVPVCDRTARKATDVSFSGDRSAQAREAFVLYDAALNAGSLITTVAQ